MKFIYFLTLQILIGLDCLAQIDITFPLSRMVIQRDNNNEALVEIAGNIAEQADSIQAKFTTVPGYEGENTPWVTIVKNQTKAMYFGKIKVKGGWYELHVRYFKDGIQKSAPKLDRVGIGEVFVVAGQSNAEGNLAYPKSEKGAKDDRVSVINFIDPIVNENTLPFTFTHLDDYSKIAPYNPVPWIWAVLGDELTAKYKVPVLFFGAAVGGTSSWHWANSAKGVSLNLISPSIFKFNGSPYGVLLRTIKNYASRTGFRAILWQQGESDYFTGQTEYFDNIKFIIELIRADFKQNISWITAQSSRTPFPSSFITNAQLKLTQEISNVYLGPNTDLLFGLENRIDGIHFAGDGIKNAGKAWSDALTSNNYLTKIPVIQASELIQPQLSCFNSSNAQVLAKPDKFYQQVYWSNGQTTENIVLNADNSVSLKAVDVNGLFRYSPQIKTIGFENTNITPIISGPIIFCEGIQNTTLKATVDQILWSNGETKKEIFPVKTGSYFFKLKNNYGCEINSNSVNITVLPKPVPTLNFSTGLPAFCLDETLVINTSGNYKNIKWSTVNSGPEITLNTPGKYWIQVTDQNECQSDTTNFLITGINKPNQPIIKKQTPFSLGILNFDQNLQYDWFYYDSPYLENKNSFRINNTGAYAVRASQQFELDNLALSCTSETSLTYLVEDKDLLVPIKTYPNPIVDFLKIDLLETQENISFEIFNSNGQKILTGEIAAKDFSTGIDLRDLKAGQYIIRFFYQYKTIEHRFLIN